MIIKKDDNNKLIVPEAITKGAIVASSAGALWAAKRLASFVMNRVTSKPVSVIQQKQQTIRITHRWFRRLPDGRTYEGGDEVTICQER